jgi:hypothetical protein
MKTKVLKPNNLMNILALMFAGTLLTFILMVTFYFGTVWNKNRGNNPVILPATNTPFLSWTETATALPTETPLDTTSPTMTPEPTATPPATEKPTFTPMPTATITSTATATLTATSTPSTADWAEFIKEIEVPNGSYFAPGISFEKIWRIKNIGKTVWTKEYDLVYVKGRAMTEKKVLPLPTNVNINESIDISLKLVSPTVPGEYDGRWMLRNVDGQLFGVGPNADQAFRVKIQVLNLNPNVSYDFLLNMREAKWYNGEDEIIRFPIEQKPEKEFVKIWANPNLESGKSDIPAIWVHPNETQEVNKIYGIYPSYTIKDGDHFIAKAGCIKQYPDCNLVFILRYIKEDDSVVTLGTWQEIYDGKITDIDIDLSALAGEEVRFVLRMNCANKKYKDAQGFWMAPRIEYIEPTPTPTLTPTETPSPTPTEIPILPSDIPMF